MSSRPSIQTPSTNCLLSNRSESRFVGAASGHRHRGWLYHLEDPWKGWPGAYVLGLLAAIGLAGCDGGGNAANPVPAAPAPPSEPARPPRLTEPPRAPPTSYELQASALPTDWGALLDSRWCHAHAVAYGDFDGDGDEDTFVAEVSLEDGPDWALSMHPAPVNMFLNEGPAGFRLSDEVFRGPVPRIVHPRKALSGDFNGDGRLDIFVAATGFDRPPFPRESPVLILSTERGLQQVSDLEHLIGNFHGAASADIDYDGDLDILVTDTGGLLRPVGTYGPFLLLNSGTGTFSFDQSRLPAEVNDPRNMLIYTAEVVDVDGDSRPDLLFAGHEYDGRDTVIYWGDATGTYESSRKTVLPAVEGQGIVVDIDAEDLDGDGVREVILDRTTSEPFYRGFYIQILSGLGGREFADETEGRIVGGADPDAEWLDWLRVIDLNDDGALDIFADDCEDHGLNWLNDGSGRLRPGPGQ